MVIIAIIKVEIFMQSDFSVSSVFEYLYSIRTCSCRRQVIVVQRFNVLRCLESMFGRPGFDTWMRHALSLENEHELVETTESIWKGKILA